MAKLADLVAGCGELYGIKIVHGDTVKMKHVKKLRKKLYALKQEEHIVFVHGIGKRKSPLQKSIETLEEYPDRLKGYNQKLYICGNRNSFSKTDQDATFMRMKEDAMGNGQMAFIKQANYEISKKRTYQNDIGRIENMDYDETKDSYTCRNEKELPLAYIRHSKSKTGHVGEKHIYQCTDCKDCPYKMNALKGTTARHQWKKGIKCFP